jgi:glycosyltransferase involved in cell wall biosynthesis
LEEILHIFNLQVHSSIYEGIPMAILQGMVVGLPIVATDVGGIHEVLTPGENALLVNPGSPDAIAEAVLRLMDDRALAARLGRAAQVYVKQNYSMEATMEQLGSVYRRVCTPPQDRRDRIHR